MKDFCEKKDPPISLHLIEYKEVVLLFPCGAFLPFRLGRGGLGIGQTGQHGVRGNAVVCSVVRQTSREPDYSHLCRDVVTHAGNG
jgi:hypothetical protein